MGCPGPARPGPRAPRTAGEDHRLAAEQCGRCPDRSITIIYVLNNLDVDIAPLLTSVGILGVAIGFGAQQLIRDFLAGIFITIEDQYGIGDVIETSEVVGTVESVGLRITRVRSEDGAIWYLRNGEILRVGNRSQGNYVAPVDESADVPDPDSAPPAEGRRVTMSTPTPDQSQPKMLMQNDPFTQPGYTDNFYDAVGGHETFVKLIDVFYDGVATDPLLRPMYPEEDLGPAKRRFLMFLEQYWGGPTTYGEERGHPRLRMRHMPFRVTPEAKDRWLHHMRTAVDALELPPLYEGTLWDYMERAALSMVNSPSDA